VIGWAANLTGKSRHGRLSYSQRYTLASRPARVVARCTRISARNQLRDKVRNELYQQRESAVIRLAPDHVHEMHEMNSQTFYMV
jgi:hypothetical protein